MPSNHAITKPNQISDKELNSNGRPNQSGMFIVLY